MHCSHLYVLAQARYGGERIKAETCNRLRLLFFVWEIGCGYLDDNSIQILSKIESRFEESPNISDWVNLLEIQTEVVLLDWMVGEYEQMPKFRSKRQTFQGYQPIYPSRTAGAVFEASGLSPSDLISPLISNANENSPILVHPMVPLEITVQQISNVRIPPNTFHSPDGTKLVLKLFEYSTSMQFGLDAKDHSAATGREIGNDESSWISFDSVTEILRLRPYPEHEGSHKFVLCAFNILNSRTCSKF